MKKLIFSVLQMFLSVTLMFADNFKNVLYQNDNLPTAIYQSDSYPWKVGNGYVASSNYSASNYSQYYHDSHSTSWFEAEIYAGEDSALVSFEYQVDYYYEGGNGWGGGWTYGNLYFKIDGVEYLRCNKTAEWGESPSWMKAEFKVAKGYHVLRWEFKLGDVGGMQTGSEIAKVRNLDIDKNDVDNGFLVLNKKTINFKNKEAGSSTLDTLELHNVGTKDIHITYIDGPSAPYRIIGDVANFAIPAGGKKNIVVAYTPTDEGYWEQYLDVESTQGVQSVKIKGLCHNGYVADNPTPGQLEHVVTNRNCDSLAIIGTLNGNDQNFLHKLKNLKYLNLLATDIEIIQNGGVGNLAGLEELLLPSTWKYIDYYMWQNLSWNSETKQNEYLKLTSVTTLATKPPTVWHYEGEDGSFKGIKEGTLLYVPVASISAYSESEQWSRFTILPITEELKTLKVVLPQNGDYKNMILELENTKNGQKQRFVITDKNTYTFKGLQTKYSYNVIMRTPDGVELGSIKNILLEEEHKEVRFSKLLPLGKASLRVLQLPDSTDVTDKVQVNWYNSQGEFLKQGNKLDGLVAGTQILYKITLPEELGTQYAFPKDSLCSVTDGENNITLQLQPIEKITISGIVKDSITGEILPDAYIYIRQLLNGKYTVSSTNQSDEKGYFAMELYKDSTVVTVSASNYISKKITEARESYGDIYLKPITGTVITTSFTYTASRQGDDDTTEVQDWYDDTDNISYSIYNETTGKSIKDFNVQYPNIVLLDETNIGDSLTITVSCKKNSFRTITTGTTIGSDNLANIQIDIMQLGGISASFRTTENNSVEGVLYDADGHFVSKQTYKNARIELDELQDGDYILVTMGGSDLYNSVYNFSELTAIGLIENVDYLTDSIHVQSGRYSFVENEEVPLLDESKLYYTGQSTVFSVNKSNIIVGNYLTLESRLDFKEDYINEVDNIYMIYDIPKSASFVENSVMVGNKTMNYTIEENRLTVPVSNNKERVRFCIIPIQNGTFSPNAFVQFDIAGNTQKQPIGNATYTATGFSINVPKTITKTEVPITGKAIGKSKIEIYANDLLIGETTSSANGSWSTTCLLNKPYNLSTYKIYAQATTPQGMKLLSETKECMYDRNAVQVSKVTMYHDTYKSVFNFMNPSSKPNQWTVYYPKKVFTYTVEFTNNSPEVVSNVVLYIHAANGQIVPLKPTYDEKKNLWVADLDMGNRADSYYPVNVSVDFNAITPIMGDRSEISDKQECLSDVISETKIERENLISEYYSIEEDDENVRTLQSLLCNENADEDEINRLLDIVLGNISSSTVMLTDDEFAALEIEADKLISEWDNVHDSTLINQLLENCFDEPFYDYEDEISLSIPTSNGTKLCKKEIVNEIDEDSLMSEGYIKMNLNDGSSLYYLFLENSVIIVDVLKKEKYSIVITELGNEYSRYASNRANLVGYLTCGENAISTLKDVYSRVQGSSDNRRRMAEIAAGLLEVKNELACYYEGLYTDLVGKIKDAYEAANEIINKDKEVYEDLKGVCEFKLKEIRKDIADLEEINNSYKHDLYILNGKESLTDAEKAMKATLETRIKEQEATLRELKESRQKWFQRTQKYEKELEKITKKGNLITKHYIKVKNSIVSKLPARLTNFVKLPATIEVCGKLAGTCGLAIQVIGLYTSVTEIGEDAKEWLKVMNMIDEKLPCEPNGDSLKEEIYDNAAWHIGQNFASLASDAASIVISTAGGVPGSPTWWIDMTVNVLLTPSRLFNGHASERDRNNYIGEIYSLKCNDDDSNDDSNDDDSNDDDSNDDDSNDDDSNDDDSNDDGNDGSNDGSDNNDNSKDGGNYPSGQEDDNVKIDPSGYVYEGVPSNRLQGVTATVYYKETVEDMYGDKHEEIRMWDAEEYGQQNPLITDEYGMYRWDVPQGLWQVKFEKEGYETTYSDWLPVPPPQLDVNIPMKQFVQPEVKDVRAYESGIAIEFEKYMLPDSLNTNNIRVMRADSTWVNGKIEWANREQVSDTDSLTFVSKVKFIPDTPFLPTDTVTLTINSHVVSYTGIQMEEDYIRTFCITNEVTGMEVDSLVRVLYGGEKELVINALPSFAAAGKRLIVGMSSTMIASVDADTLTFDVNGQATLTVKGELPGFTILSMQVDSTDIQAVTSVFVGNASQVMTIAPRASLASGIEVESGTTVALTCETANATIYYTLDGSCPCNEAARIEYSSPIVIDKNMIIKAIAINPELGESEIVTYTYKVKSVDKTEKESISTPTVTCLPISGGVELHGVQDQDVSVFNLQGLLMYKTLDIKRNKLSIKLPEGLYIVRVYSQSFKVQVKK